MIVHPRPAPADELHMAKVHGFVREMSARGIDEYTAAPPFWRFLWRKGLRVPPPLFLPWYLLLTVTALGFGLPMGLAMGAFFGIMKTLWSALSPETAEWIEMPVLDFGLGMLILGGVAFGIAMTVSSRWKARRLKLGSWATYAPPK